MLQTQPRSLSQCLQPPPGTYTSPLSAHLPATTVTPDRKQTGLAQGLSALGARGWRGGRRIIVGSTSKVRMRLSPTGMFE